MNCEKLVCLVVALLACAACGGTTAFEGSSTTPVIGNLPPPPPPPAPVVQAPPPPRVEVRDNQIAISEKIQFDIDKASIKPESHSLLDEVAATFKSHPQIKKVSIDGFTSSEGTPEFNQRLSDERAKAVMAYLVTHGVDKDRVTAKGWGADKPLADNSTEDGREKNRRVEFNIVDQEVTKQKVEIDPATGKEKVIETSTAEVKDPATTPPSTTDAKGGK